MRESTPGPSLGSHHSLVAREMADEKETPLPHRDNWDSRDEKIQTLCEQDTLISWIRQGKVLSDSSNDKEFASLIRRLIQLKLSAEDERSSPGDPVVPASAPLGAEGPAQTPAMTETAMFASIPGVRQPGRTDADSRAYLAPPQGLDELGRLGPYRVLEVLGSGGMGVVFRAEDPQLQRPVALKVMRPALAANTSARQRFLREARAAASIKHDHIVSIYQVDEDRDVPFLAMEHLEGESLDDRLKRESKLSQDDALRIGREIAEGLEAAHDKGLIHRDIKPGNVWLEGQRGRVKILDFGLARTTGDDVHLTQSGAIVGTPAYMPPEQGRGDRVDARCDLYSLGCVLYRMCTGELPFKGHNTMSMLFALATEQPRSPREINADVPPVLADLILRLLAKDPARRPATARDVVEALRDISLHSSPAKPTSCLPGLAWRRRTLLAAVAGTFLFLTLLTVLVLRLHGTEEGAITLKIDDPNAELVFENGEREITIRDKKSGREIKLPFGTYRVELKAGKTGTPNAASRPEDAFTGRFAR
ncbi:MAG TPA: serine/threonine-protein kinase [Gemmataceae bacterium]